MPSHLNVAAKHLNFGKLYRDTDATSSNKITEFVVYIRHAITLQHFNSFLLYCVPF